IAARDNELLRAAIGADFRCVDIAFRIHGQVVKDIELPGRVAAAAESGQHLERLSIENRNLCITQVRYIQELLLGIGRKREARGGLPHGTDELLSDEFSCGREDLNSMIAAVRDVHESVSRNFD